MKNNSIEDIVKKGEILNLSLIHPTLQEMNEMNKVIKQYIKQHKLIIYGGTAIEILLRSKGITFSDKDKFLDYDFYSPKFIEDSIALANKLYKDGYKYVRRVNAIHPDTVRIGAEFAKEFLADITYIPEKAFKMLPTKQISDINYIDPQFLKVDLYRSMCRPNSNVYRWKKVWPRLVNIELKFPLFPSKTIPRSKSPPKVTKVAHIIMKFLQNPEEKIIATGTMAFNLFLTVANQKNKSIPIELYEVFAINPKVIAKELMKLIPKTKCVNYYSYLELLPKKSTIFLDSTPIVDIYEIGFDCIPLREINRIQVTNYHRLLEFLYAKYNIEIITKKKEKTTIYNYIIPTLQAVANEYNNKNALDGTESDNPFRIFQTDCFTSNLDAIRIEPIKKMFYGVKSYPGYKPEKNMIDPKDMDIEYENNYMGEEIKTRKEISLENSILESIEDDIKEIRKKEKGSSILSKRKSKQHVLGGSRRSVSFAKRLTQTKYIEPIILQK